MDEIVQAHFEALESHVARIEGILHVLLEEIEKGTAQQAAKEIRSMLPRIFDEDLG